MKSLYESIYESIFSTPNPENIKNLMFLDALKKMIGGDGYNRYLSINSLGPDIQLDILKSNSYYDKKSASMHIGVDLPSSAILMDIYGLSDIYRICKENGLIVNNIIFDDFECRLDIRNNCKVYDGRNKISKISSEIPMNIHLSDGVYKNMDFSGMNLITSKSKYDSTFHINNSTLTDVNLGSHPENLLCVSTHKSYSTGPLLFDNVTGEFKSADVTIITYNSSRWDKKLSEACFVDYDFTIKHGDKDTVVINPNILANLGLDKIKCKKTNIEISLNHNKNGHFLITIANGKIKIKECALS